MKMLHIPTVNYKGTCTEQVDLIMFSHIPSGFKRYTQRVFGTETRDRPKAVNTGKEPSHVSCVNIMWREGNNWFRLGTHT